MRCRRRSPCERSRAELEPTPIGERVVSSRHIRFLQRSSTRTQEVPFSDCRPVFVEEYLAGSIGRICFNRISGEKGTLRIWGRCRRAGNCRRSGIVSRSRAVGADRQPAPYRVDSKEAARPRTLDHDNIQSRIVCSAEFAPDLLGNVNILVRRICKIISLPVAAARKNLSVGIRDIQIVIGIRVVPGISPLQRHPCGCSSDFIRCDRTGKRVL